MPTETLDTTGRNEPVADQAVSFADLGLAEPLLRGVEALGYTTPTRVQVDMIPVALTGKDILAQSRTGTGKTAAFGLPILHQIDVGPPIEALILVPTRELAVQVAEDLKIGRAHV